MALIMAFAFAFLLALVRSQDQGGAPKQRTCADMMQGVNDCLDQLQDSQDAKMFHARRKEIFKKCVPYQPAQCSGQLSAMERCNEQMRSDPTLRKSRDEIKPSVAQCYERFPNTRKAGGGRPTFPQGPMGPGQMAPPPGPPSFGPQPPLQPGMPTDPCVPTGEQMLCIKHLMDTDKNMTTVAASLHEKERQCFTKDPNLINCRPDNAQLRACLDQTAQSFMHKVGEKMQKCVRDAGYDMPPLPPPPPQAFSG